MKYNDLYFTENNKGFDITIKSNFYSSINKEWLLNEDVVIEEGKISTSVKLIQ